MRVWRVLSGVALLSALAGPATTAVLAQSATCFGQPATVIDNGPGDQDSRVHVIRAAAKAVIIGTDGDDVIVGSGAVGELICGLGGDDHIQSSPGDQTSIDGGSGNDTIDINSILTGQGSFAFIHGGPGNDTIQGNIPTFVRVFGEDGNDTVRLTGGGIYLVSGGPGTDTIDLQPIITEVLGDAGNDHIRVARQSFTPTVTIDGGPGNDIIDLPDGANFSLGQQIPNRVLGGDGNDTLNIGVGGVVADGGPGNDRIRLVDGQSVAEVLGGAGNDQIDVHSLAPVGVVAGAGNDTVVHNAPGGCDPDGPHADRCVVDGGPGQDVCSGQPGITFEACEVTP